MLVIMRHGQRGDNEYPQINSEVLFDPPITNQAKQTLQKSAQQIGEFFKNNNIQKFTIVSSPFLRCLMTAQLFSFQMKKYGIKEQQQRLVDYQISQFMRPDWFKQYPLKSLLLDFQQQQVLYKYLKEPKKWVKKDFDHDINFPQNYGHFSRRITNFKKKIKFPQQKKAIICVTHGFVVRQMCWRMNQIPNFSGQINFCGYVIYSNETGNKDILLKSKL